MPLDRDELARFIARYQEALGSSPTRGAWEDADSSGVSFGLDLGHLQREAFRRALPDEGGLLLPVLLEVPLPPHVATGPGPTGHASQTAATQLVTAAAAIVRARSAAARVERGAASASSLRDPLAEALTETSRASLLVGELAAGRAGPDRRASRTAVVVCPLDGGPVAVALSCARCAWQGSRPRTCFVPAARLYVDALRRASGPPVLQAE